MEEMKSFNWPVEADSRKRKAISSGKSKVEEESLGKRFKSEEESSSDGKNSKKENPPKQDFIHVRARRGQATDSHSLAERVRREKISQRMKFLQDLVPGCNKVTGKAVMLDEIINYVQSLQRQVEFLSMKLATVNPQLDLNIESLLSKEMHQATASLPEPGYPFDFRAAAAAFPFLPPPPLPLHSLPTAAVDNGLPGQFSLGPAECFPHEHSQFGPLWDEDLHAFGHAAFDQGAEAFHDLLPSDQMKVEL